MIDALKRKLGMTPAAATAETEKEVTTMTTDTDAVLETVDVPALQAALALAKSDLADATSKIAELTTIVEKAAEFTAAQEKAELETKLSARKAKVIAAVGTVKADALMAATASMEDTAFDAVMAAMATTATVEATTALFSEVGVDAEVDPSKVQAETNGTMDYLTTKYGKK